MSCLNTVCFNPFAFTDEISESPIRRTCLDVSDFCSENLGVGLGMGPAFRFCFGLGAGRGRWDVCFAVLGSLELSLS